MPSGRFQGGAPGDCPYEAKKKGSEGGKEIAYPRGKGATKW